MGLLGVIGGSGLYKLESLEDIRTEIVQTPYGDTSSPLVFGSIHGQPLLFIARHGLTHQIPPHKVNYRANIWAMHHFRVDQVLAVAAVGSINSRYLPGMICVTDQLIDYSYGREQTFFSGDGSSVTHIDFTEPYCGKLRLEVIEAINNLSFNFLDKGVYGCTQGPRLETTAEILRMQRDGCDMVGMTGMPEASLAKELGICYANLSLSVNWAAGLSQGPISMQGIEKELAQGMRQVATVLDEVCLQRDA